MEVSYEMRIRCENPGGFYVEHPLGRYPDRETIVLLKEEAVETFEALYDSPPGEVFIEVVHLGHQDTVTLRFEDEDEEVESHDGD